MFRTSLLIPALSLLAVGIACSNDDSVVDPPDPTEVEDLETARELWASRGSADYSIQQERVCFCGGPRSWRADVEGGELVAVHFDDSTGDMNLESARTVADIFDLVERGYAEAAEFHVEFDSVYGFVREVYVDWNKAIADDEIRWKMSDLILD